MDTFLTIVAFFVGLFTIFALGGFIGHILKLDEYLQNDLHRKSKKHIQNRLKLTGRDLSH